MRYKFIILFLFISFIGKAQVYQLMPQYGYDAKRMNFDSTIQIPTFCGVPKLGSNVTKKGALAFDSCNNRFYYFNPKFQSWDTIKSADATLFVKYTDTASMLTNYINSVNYGLLKLGKTISVDTSVLSTKYLRIVDTANKFVSSVTKLNDSTIRVIKDGTTTDITINAVTSATRLITQVWNNTGATILRGSVVYISGRHSSNLPTIALAKGNNEANSYKTFALVDGDIPDNSSGFVIQAGKITGLNLPTSSYTDGDILYLSPTVPGGYTITKPLAPNHIVKLGSVTRAHPTQGSIEIKIENGWQLDELSDVQIASVPADSSLLQFSRVDSLWHDVSPLTAMGNRFVKTTDSASMLAPYLRSNVAAATYATISQNNLKLNISDTSAMLTNYAKTSLVNTKLNISDTATMLSPYARTNSVNASLATKLNISDSAAMLLPYLRKIDTASLSNRINLKQNLISLTTTGTSGAATFNQSTGALNIPQYSGTNIYNSDGSLSGARVLTLNSNPLDLAGTTTTRFFANGNIGIGTTTDVASAQLQVTTTTKGFLQPRLTTTQMNAISTPATGLSVFNTTDSVPYTYRGSVGGWQKNVIYNRNNDIALFNGANQRIMIDTVSNVTAGRQLTVEAGSTQAGGTSAFQTLSQGNRDWEGMATAPNGDIYVVANSNNIYRRVNNTGNFTSIGAGALAWIGIAINQSNSDIYATAYPGGGNGQVYKQTGGTGAFNSLGLTGRIYYGIAVAPNGDVYVVANNAGSGSDIYKSTNGGTSFTSLGAGSRAWFGITVTPNGDIYASVAGGDIWKSTNGGTTFTALSATGSNRNWSLMGSSSSGEIYATVTNGDIWKSSDAGATWSALGQTSRVWRGITVANNGDIYAAAEGGDIYIQTQGTANLNGGTLVLQSGVGKGTGTSTINFNTGTTLSSGNTLQNVSTKMTILGNGNVGIGTTSPSAKLELSDTARGFLQTRMTTTQRNNISSPSVGLQVFTTTDSSQYVYRGTGAGWQQLANEIVNTASLNFPSTNAQNSSDLTITLTGAVDGDAVVLGVPNAAVNANSCYTAWVSAANTVTVRFNNYSSGAIDPAQATFKVTIIK